MVRDGRVVYGITTGFGKFSDVVIPKKEALILQENLIKSHACGVGAPFTKGIVRAIMLLRANALAKGFSGIRVETVQLLLHFLNRGIHPVIPEQGSLGASGDLAPLAHMVLPMLGLGEVEYKGRILPAKEALAKENLHPIQLTEKEGLALINGTQAMAGIAAYAWKKINDLLLLADLIAALSVEALHGIPMAYHPLLQEVRPHPGQRETAENLLMFLEGSSEVSKPGERRVQDAYSLRCIPQVHGASKAAFRHFSEILQVEINSATDNPLIFPEAGEVISGGNFHGQPLGLIGDYMAIALSELADISERRIERLVNPALSGLPPFLTRHGGLHSGMMIAQYVAASLVSENKILSHPASVDSIPSSANQEDHVSMGTTAMRKLLQVMENLTHVLAIEALVAAQGVEFGGKRLGKWTSRLYQALRKKIPPLEEDRILHEDIFKVVEMIKGEEIPLPEKVPAV
ncbi:MAG: histidine ammonia-lyase [Thermicanus sp.]|nr:histidine ammonia-lyase [Thermicanus sp.]